MRDSFWKGRPVLVTGHTGFKGAWLSLLLQHLGAKVAGFSLQVADQRSAFPAMAPWFDIDHQLGDLRSRHQVLDRLDSFQPSVVFHLAAQALVRESYRDPWETFSTNIQGTVNLLEAVITTRSVEAILVVTTDKVYEPAADRAHSESDRLGGADPYSGSKAAVELVLKSLNSIVDKAGIVAGSARAGNIIGGGDRGRDRLIPDIVRSIERSEAIMLRNPHAIRPWQFVLEPLVGYVRFAEHLLCSSEPVSALNFGPTPSEGGVSVEQIARAAVGHLGGGEIEVDLERGPYENPSLQVDPSAAGSALGWRTRLTAPEAVKWTMEWFKAQADGHNMRTYSQEQLVRYLELQPHGK